MNWFKNLKISAKLTAAVSLVLLATMISGGLSLWELSTLDDSVIDLATNAMPSIKVLAKLDHDINEFRRCEFQDVLATDKADMDTWEKRMADTLADLKKDAKTYEPMISYPGEKELYSEFKNNFDLYMDVHEKILVLARQNRDADADALMRGDSSKYFLAMSDAIDKDIALNEKGGNDSYRKAMAVYNSARITLVISTVISILVGIVLALIIGRMITTSMARAVSVANRLADGDLTVNIEADSLDETGQLLSAMQHMVQSLRDMISRTVDISTGIASASNQLHSTSAQIATGAEEVASQTNTVATASEEMSATSSDIARNCTMAAEASRQTTESANAGAKVVNETITGMSVIADQVRQTSKTVEALGSRSDQIGQIVGTIEDIADQTNLLALNAAIEAARAGEQGRGFAVVADEVRALAERTTKATREIGEMIKAIQSETREAVKAMEDGVHEVEKGAVSSQKSGHALEEILERINEVTMQINQIATAAEQQTATTSEITSNIQQVTEVVHQTARGADETAGAAAQLATQAQQLQNLVSRFRL